jgi:hypothetical protein
MVLMGITDLAWVTELAFIHASHLLLVLLALRGKRKRDTFRTRAS